MLHKKFFYLLNGREACSMQGTGQNSANIGILPLNLIFEEKISKMMQKYGGIFTKIRESNDVFWQAACPCSKLFR